ncbi:MAG: hypothetical protein IKF64_04850 [Eubacterium sp.]|nr:hypothetical protein [Eubacterium sp.]
MKKTLSLIMSLVMILTLSSLPFSASANDEKIKLTEDMIDWGNTILFLPVREIDSIDNSVACDITINDGERNLISPEDYDVFAYVETSDGRMETVYPFEEPGKYIVQVVAFEDGDYEGTFEKEYSVFETRNNWGEQKVVDNHVFYVDEKGATSAEITSLNSDENGIIWLKEDSGDNSTWYGIDNPNGVFEEGSQFSVRWLDNESDKQDYEALAKKLDNSGDLGAKVCFFDVGVINPDGNQLGSLNGNRINFYVQLGEDWDDSEIRAYYISDGKDEEIGVEIKDDLGGNTGKRFAELKMQHFSPYVIYQKKKTTPAPQPPASQTPAVTENNTVTTVEKKSYTLSVKAKKPTVKYANLKKKSRKIARKNLLTVKNAKGTVTYSLASAKKGKKNVKKFFKINKKNGQLTIKKGLKKGTYKVRIKVSAAGNAEYKAASKTVTVTIKVN